MGTYNEKDDSHSIFSSSSSKFAIGGGSSWIEFVHDDQDEKLFDIQTSQNDMDIDICNEDIDPLLFFSFESINFFEDKGYGDGNHNVIENSIFLL